jgi:hypothetical protein
MLCDYINVNYFSQKKDAHLVLAYLWVVPEGEFGKVVVEMKS